MPSLFGNVGSTADDLIDADNKKHFAFTKRVKLCTSATNGMKMEFNKTIKSDGKVDGDATMKYKHSSGINIKKAKATSGGKMALEGELANAFDNTKLYMKIGTLPSATNAWSKAEMERDASTGGYKEEKGEIGFEFVNKDIAAHMGVNFLCGDAPMLTASAMMDVPGVDNLSIGGDLAYRTALDTWGDATGSGGDAKIGESAAKGLQLKGPSTVGSFPFQVGALYEVKNDFALSAVLNCQDRADTPKINVKFSQVLNSDTNVAATLDTDTTMAAPEITLGGSYSVDKDTTLYTSMAFKADTTINFALKQKISGNVGLDLSGALDPVKMDSTKFGLGLNISN